MDNTRSQDLSSPDHVLVWNPNPTLDVVNVVADLKGGEVHRAEQQTLSAGGKGTLVVRGLQILGVPCQGVAPLAGEVGSVVEQLFQREGLPMLVSNVEGQTRLAITINESGAVDTVINGPGPLANGPRWRAHLDSVCNCLEAIRPTFFVIAGRPSLSVDIDDVRRVIELATTIGARVVLDLSSPILEACLPLRPWLVKVNVQEAQAATSSSRTGALLIAVIREHGAQNAVLTSGPGAVAGSIDGWDFEAIPPRVNLATAVGCGDSFLAGMMSALAEIPSRDDLAAVITTAIAAGSASAEDLRPGYFALDRVETLRQHVQLRTTFRAE